MTTKTLTSKSTVVGPNGSEHTLTKIWQQENQETLSGQSNPFDHAPSYSVDGETVNRHIGEDGKPFYKGIHTGVIYTTP